MAAGSSLQLDPTPSAKPPKMNGQWIGTYSGNSTGKLILNIDSQESCYVGVAYVLEDDSSLPSTAVAFRTNSKDPTVSVRADVILPLDSCDWSYYRLGKLEEKVSFRLNVIEVRRRQYSS
jgi:hypothetical protein